MTDIDFDINWLNERFPFDSEARNNEIEGKCFNYFKGKTSINIIDIGSGTAASCIYFINQWKINQNWTLIELNPDLIIAALERLENFGKDYHFKVIKGNNKISLHKPDQKINITILQKSFLELDDFIKWDTINLMTATAVFDLVSPKMFKEIINPLIKNKIPLLSTINYVDMDIYPKSDQNSDYTNKYTNQHMRRTHDFGQTMGGHTTKEVQNIFTQLAIKNHFGNSDWIIKAKDQQMVEYLLGFMAGALPIYMNDDEKLAFNQWLTHSKNNNDLEIIVNHTDFFMYF